VALEQNNAGYTGRREIEKVTRGVEAKQLFKAVKVNVG